MYFLKCYIRFCKMCYVFFSKCNRNFYNTKRNPYIHKGFRTETVGFEPTCLLGQNDFESFSLWPLRYVSTIFISISHALPSSKSSKHLITMHILTKLLHLSLAKLHNQQFNCHLVCHQTCLDLRFHLGTIF